MAKRLLPPLASLVPKNATRVFKGIIYDVYQWQQEMFDGTYKTFEMLKRPSTVQVLAVKNDKIVILDQEQPGHKPFFDLPGGRHDIIGESELEATKRELLEETGMRFKTWKLIDVTQPAPKVEQFIYLFLASDFVDQVDQHLDNGEKIKVLELAYEEVLALMNNPEVRHLPKDILRAAGSLEGLISLPEFEAIEENE